MTYTTTKRRLSEHQVVTRSFIRVKPLTSWSRARHWRLWMQSHTCSTSRDLSKAFDSIDHATLLAKQQALGVSRASLDWFNSYLSERLQCVRMGAETWSLQGISHGVPQGSILGPALFTIYLNNIPSIPDVFYRIICWWFRVVPFVP